MKKHDPVGSPDASYPIDVSNLPLLGMSIIPRFFLEEGIVMTLMIYYDGQFWVGVIELHENERLKVYRYVFGTEPSDAEMLEFVNHRLLAVIDNNSQVNAYQIVPGKKEYTSSSITAQLCNTYD